MGTTYAVLNYSKSQYLDTHEKQAQFVAGDGAKLLACLLLPNEAWHQDHVGIVTEHHALYDAIIGEQVVWGNVTRAAYTAYNRRFPETPLDPSYLDDDGT